MNNNSSMRFAGLIKQELLARRIRQRTIAKTAKVKDSGVSTCLRDQTPISKNILWAIAIHIDADPLELAALQAREEMDVFIRSLASIHASHRAISDPNIRNMRSARYLVLRQRSQRTPHCVEIHQGRARNVQTSARPELKLMSANFHTLAAFVVAVRSELIERRISWKTVAKAAWVAESGVSRCLSGEVAVSQSILFAVANLIEADPRDLAAQQARAAMAAFMNAQLQSPKADQPADPTAGRPVASGIKCHICQSGDAQP